MTPAEDHRASQVADLRRRFKLAIGRIALAGLLDPESAKDAESRRLGLGLLAQVFTRDESLTPALVFQRVAAGLADALGVLQIVARQAAKAAKDGAAEDDARSWLALVDDLDFGCALMLRNLQITGSLLALETRGSDLMVDATMQANGDAGTLRRLLALCEAVQPEEFMAEDGPVAYAIREAAAKVELVHELAGRLPHLAREEARQMDAWPLLVSRREADGRRHREWLKSLELGRDYPLDCGPGARFRPDNPMVRYLKRWVDTVLRCRENLAWHVHSGGRRRRPFSEAVLDQKEASGGRPGPALERLGRIATRLPRLTRGTSSRWSRELLVPLIMLTDARLPETCVEPALQAIWRQRGVKSPATFRSRLLTAVRQTLRAMARE